jgi:hypothetical protein
MTHLLDTDHVSILERQGAEYAIVLANMARHAVEDVGVRGERAGASPRMPEHD